MKDFVVDFNLPSDDDLFVHHGTNISARNSSEAESLFRVLFPAATVRRIHEGVVMLYGDLYATWDSSRGADCAPRSKKSAFYIT